MGSIFSGLVQVEILKSQLPIKFTV
jgi:hypothetical protein